MTSPLAHLVPEFAGPMHPVWGEIAPAPGRPGFLPSEFKRPHEMDAHFLRWLWAVRGDTGTVPMRIISDARDPGVGASRSAHLDRPCRAVDLQVYNAAERATITVAAILHGCRRWGTYPGKVTAAGPDQAGLHFDCSTSHPSPRNWTRF